MKKFMQKFSSLVLALLLFFSISNGMLHPLAESNASQSGQVNGEKYVTVEFKVNPPKSSKVDPIPNQILTKGDKAKAPSPSPTCSEYKFVGWYLGGEAPMPFDFDEPINEDIILEAKWVEEPSPFVYINKDSFPDDDFRLHLLNGFKHETPKHGDPYFTKKEIDAITDMNFDFNDNIKSYKGIEYFENLKTFRCTYNSSLSELDVSKNTALEELDCDNCCELKNLNLGNNKNLKKLNFEHCAITNLDASGCENLPALNGFSQESTAYMQKDGQHYKVDMNKVIGQSGNISKVHFIDRKEWKWAEGQTGIAEYYGSDFPENLRYLYSPTEFLDFDVKLNLILNGSICSINKQNFPDDNFRNYLLKNTKHEGSGNDAYYTKDQLADVKEIDCSDKKIKDLTGIENFTNLQWLYCENNEITNLDLSNNKALTKLYCQGNKLSNLNVEQNTALTVLDCDQNQLNSLYVAEKTKFDVLDCRNNHLTSLDASKLLKEDAFVFLCSGQTANATLIKDGDKYTVDMNKVIGKKGDIKNVILTDGWSLGDDGIAKYNGGDVPQKLSYKYKTDKNTNHVLDVELSFNN